jgi:hypothetical protein
MLMFGGRNGLRRMDDLYSLELKQSLGEVGSAKSIQALKKLKDFEMKETLGTGSFGRVRLWYPLIFSKNILHVAFTIFMG